MSNPQSPLPRSIGASIAIIPNSDHMDVAIAQTTESVIKKFWFALLDFLHLSDRKNKDRRGALLDELLVESQRSSDHDAHSLEHKILSNIRDLRERTAYDVAIPRADITAVHLETSLQDLFKVFHQSSHSRLPVYGENLDDILGMIHIKDVIRFVATDALFTVGDILHKVLFVPPSIRVADLLVKMNMARIHMAMLVDEFGGIDGLVTSEDLVESIIGEIEDEHDVDGDGSIDLQPDGTVLADARTLIDLFEERFGKILTLTERTEDIDTLGGLVVHLVGRVPTRGELLSHESGLAFEVVKADPRRIRQLRVRHLDRLIQKDLPSDTALLLPMPPETHSSARKPAAKHHKNEIFDHKQDVAAAESSSFDTKTSGAKTSRKASVNKATIAHNKAPYSRSRAKKQSGKNTDSEVVLTNTKRSTPKHKNHIVKVDE